MTLKEKSWLTAIGLYIYIVGIMILVGRHVSIANLGPKIFSVKDIGVIVIYNTPLLLFYFLFKQIYKHKIYIILYLLVFIALVLLAWLGLIMFS